MLCDVCRCGLEGVWDPSKTKRLLTDPRKCGEEWIEFEIPTEEYSSIRIPSFFENTPLSSFVFGHHETYQSFCRSQDDGCVICTCFSKSMLVSTRSPINGLGYYSVFMIEKNGPSLSMSVLMNKNSRGFRINPCPERLNVNIGHSTDLKNTGEMISEWLKKCEKHNRCNQQPKSGYIPTRLIELSNEMGSPKFRVVEKGSVGRYLTLSYCWGPKKPDKEKTLTQSSLPGLSEWQSIEILPKTIQDALTIVGHLCCRYLWVDRLCIFQDGNQDWHQEALFMSEIYGNSYLTIAALSSDHDNGGCFFTRDPDNVKPTIFQFSIKGPDDLRPCLFTTEELNSFYHEYNSAPLVKRGWALQERLLSPRVLYFGRKQIIWECRQENFCEILPKHAHRPLHRSGKIYLSSDPTLNIIWKQFFGSPDLQQPHSENTISNVLRHWEGIVRLYSLCELTYEKDKLVALSGLARDIKERLMPLIAPDDVTYLAGLWKFQLPQALVWRSGYKGQMNRPTVYRAPSWSWAALDGEIVLRVGSVLERTSDDILAPVVSVKSSNDNGGDETGQLGWDTIILNGCLVDAQLQLDTIDGTEMPRTRNISSLKGPDFEMIKSESSKWVIGFDTAEDICSESDIFGWK